MSLLFIAHPKETDLALFAGGELGPLSRWRIERHLQQCDGCQEAVADFFHLQSEVGELADVPSVDWKALAHHIAVRVSVDAPAVEERKPGWLSHPRAWQAGLATAALLCTIVVVRQLPTVGENAKQAAPAAVAEAPASGQDRIQETELALADQPRQDTAAAPGARPFAGAEFAQSSGEASSRDEFANKSNETAGSAQGPAPSEVAPANRQDETFRFEAARERTAPGDVEAVTPPAAEPVAVADNAVADNAVADNAVADNLAVAPPPPASRPPASPAPQPEADTAALRDRVAQGGIRQGIGGGAFRQQASVAAERRKAESVELAQAAQAAPPSRRALIGQAVLEKKTDADSAWAPERGFTVLPAALEDPAVDVGVAADGWISIRAVDANSGTITITDVYVP